MVEGLRLLSYLMQSFKASPLSRLRLLKALREVVGEVEVELPNGCKRIWHPYPPEAVSLIRKINEVVKKNGLRVSFFQRLAQ